MKTEFKIIKKYQPKGFEILYEDRDVIVGNKAIGILTVRAAWNKDATVHALLNQYIRKGNSKSRKCVYPVHRLDQATSGILVFAKSYEVQQRLKDNWANTEKIYYAVVHGHMKQKSGMISSYLEEDEDYVVHSSKREKPQSKLAKTAYEVERETTRLSLLKINLLTGRKNQIRVHMADEGHPVVGDEKYGQIKGKYPRMALHAFSLSFDHPFSGKRMTFSAELPKFFGELMGDKVQASQLPVQA